MLQETLSCFPLRAPLKAFLVFMAILFIVQMPALSYAGDTGEPKFPVSDTDFFYYHHDDHLGSSHLLTEGKASARHSGLVYKKGEILQRFEYAPFGQEVFVLNPNLKFDPSYTGQTYDIESGLYYYKSRYYNPILSRFIQPDTVVPDARNLQAYNRYSYVNNNPLKYVDPSGHFWFLFIAAIVIGAAIGAGTAAATGGSILQGALFGALQGAVSGLTFYGAGSLIVAAHLAGKSAISVLAQTLIHAAAGAVAGAINAAMTGGDLAQGSLIGGISGGAGKFAGRFLDNEGFLTQLFGRSVVGAATGATAAAITGGDPWKGAGWGAAYAAAGMVFNDLMHDKLMPYLRRVFEGSQVGAGTGVKAHVRVGPAKLEAGGHFIQGARIGIKGVESFVEDKIGISGELMGRRVAIEQVGGASGPALSYGGVSIDNAVRFELGGTIPNPYSGNAVNIELHVNLNESLSFGR